MADETILDQFGVAPSDAYLRIHEQYLPLFSPSTTTLDWDTKASNVQYYRLFRQINSDSFVELENISSGIYRKEVDIPVGVTRIRWAIVPRRNYEDLYTVYSAFYDVTPATPTTPPSITVPSTAYTNTNFTVHWGMSTNAQGGAITYYLERQQANNTWIPIVNNTDNLSTITSIPYTGTYYHRVRAKNSRGLYSDWRTSTATTVTVQNRPPSTPASITVPANIRLGIAFTVSWAASTDPDGHAITYYLDRQTNGGTWTNIAATTALQYAHTLGTTSGITSVAYRVRAKDSQGLYSDYRTSETRQISANRPPTQPPSITIPTPILHNQQVPISWGASADPDGDAITYELYRYHLVGSTATNTRIYSGANRTYTDTALPSTATRVRYDVQAKDVLGATSALRQSQIVDIIRNVPPSISGQDMDLGIFNDSVSHMYTVTDGDNDEVTVVEKINNTIVRSYKPTLGVKQRLLIYGNTFTKLQNGNHTITITATDDDGVYYTRTLTFTKQAVSLSATAAGAVPATKRPHRINVVLTGAFPSGSWHRVFVTNNGLDDAPVWEDATQAAMSKMAHVFQNTKKTHKEWAVNVKVIVHRGESIETDKCNLQGICGHWE